MESDGEKMYDTFLHKRPELGDVLENNSTYEQLTNFFRP